MALIKCTECGKEFSDKAAACPNCGCPIQEIVIPEPNIKKEEEPEVSLSSIWSTVPSKSSISSTQSSAPVKYKATQKISVVKIDEVNRKFQISGAVAVKKNSLVKKSVKGIMAFYTLGLSLAVEKMIKSGIKIGNNVWFNFSDLMSYELIEDDSVVTSGGVGQALIGGALFGGFGAVAGGITGKRVQKKRVESLCIKATLNSFDCPCVLIPLLSKPTKTNSNEYKRAFDEAHRILSALDVITHNK